MDPLEYLFRLEQFGVKLGLDNMHLICDALGRPQDAAPCVVIAGTNGKGSVGAMVEASLRIAGRRTGRYTSPHLVELEERFAIDGEPVSHGALRDAARRVVEAAERLRETGRLKTYPTFFEGTTAVAFELFRRAKVEISVLEVGLGGRLDATNVSSPVSVAITSIDFDHEEHLGQTIERIAAEKAGVIKGAIPVIAGALPDAAFETVSARCAEVGARLVSAAGDAVACNVVGMANGAAVIQVTTDRGSYGPVQLGLRGRHQVANALVAIRLLEMLGDAGLAVPADAIERGLASTRWPGRLQSVAMLGGRELLLDAAHNPAGAKALADFIGETYDRPLPIVFGVMKEKNYGRMLGTLAPHASSFVLTQAATHRACPADQLAESAATLRPPLPVHVEPSALQAVLVGLANGSPVVVTGSIFLVGEVLAACTAGALPVRNPRDILR